MILQVESFRPVYARTGRVGRKPHNLEQLKRGGRIPRFSKRGRFLEHVLYHGPHSLKSLKEFGNRANVRSYLQRLNSMHGIGYEIASDGVLVYPPPPFDKSPELLFR